MPCEIDDERHGLGRCVPVDASAANVGGGFGIISSTLDREMSGRGATVAIRLACSKRVFLLRGGGVT